MNRRNLWCDTENKDIDDLNVVKSWLCGSTDGETWSLCELFEYDVDSIESRGYVYEFPESAFDDVVGYKSDWLVDDEELEEKAKDILEGLRKLDRDIQEHPENFFQRKDKFFKCKAHEGVGCDYCSGNTNECLYEKECPFKGERGI